MTSRCIDAALSETNHPDRTFALFENSETKSLLLGVDTLKAVITFSDSLVLINYGSVSLFSGHFFSQVLNMFAYSVVLSLKGALINVFSIYSRSRAR